MRGLDEEKAQEIAQSMKRIGQISPIIIRRIVMDGVPEYVLVAGLHRLRAVEILGLVLINALVVKYDDLDARLVEIAENLHRADLTALERSRHEAEWIRLTDTKLAQVGPVSKGGRGNTGGVRAAVRELPGVTRQEAQRALKIDGITQEAEEAAREAGLDNNQSALLKIASYAFVPSDLSILLCD